jgi:hypothetical protein
MTQVKEHVIPQELLEVEQALNEGLVVWELFWTSRVHLSTPLESVLRTAEEHGVEQGVIRWIHTMFGSWQSMTVQMGCMMRVPVDQRCV